MKSGTIGATWRRPKPAGAVMRRWPLAFTPPAETLASALCRSLRMRWQFRSEVRHHRRDMAAAEAGRGRDAQVATGLHATSGDAGLGVVQVVEDALAIQI